MKNKDSTAAIRMIGLMLLGVAVGISVDAFRLVVTIRDISISMGISNVMVNILATVLMVVVTLCVAPPLGLCGVAMIVDPGSAP